MATTPKKEGTESSVLQDKPTASAAKGGDHDRIVMASRRADGSMDQTAPEFIGDKDVAIAAAKEQLGQQAASAVDVAARGVSSTPEGAAPSEPDPDVKALKDEQDKAIESAEAQAEREVNDLHQGLGD
ncbi:hypothetical protein OG279_09630 [Streptomyces sp. NBC_01201]|uniref:hypothetical protein n=1 Tax=unclassified Streptomyces TaxID=2593676 RepID=UPI002E111D1B|nr:MULTISPECIES: hypothetical protein [unclassified Streptomyces]WSR09406.1 hypothetical protein OG265_26855 [Streptomyces sp. NBC_01208]WSR47866.1 hypothetical protein OG279_09630 [Streptomyces sp. NBC_01201]